MSSVRPRYLEPTDARAARRSSSRRRPPPRERPSRLPWILAALAGVLVLVLAYALLRGDGAEKKVVEQFGQAWSAGDFGRMYALTGREGNGPPPSRAAFDAAYREATTTATATRYRVGKPEKDGDEWVLPVTVNTKVFGTIEGPVRVRLTGDGEEAKILWNRSMVFPNLPPNGRLVARTRAPRRAVLLARDGRALSDSDGNPTELGNEIGGVGSVAPPTTAALRRSLRAAGFPPDTPVGQDGLQADLEPLLRGTPGGTLSTSSGRVLARTRPRPARPVRTSLDPRIQAAANSALGGRYGGIAAIDPRTGEVLALAGIALDGLQAPGSTMKIITLTAGLEAGVAKVSDEYPVVSGATVGDRFIPNASNELCGGSLKRSFAHSCNSVFGPMGDKLGARRLIAAAEKFGFNEPPGIPGAKTSTIPKRMEEGNDEVGSSALGQGRVLATPLQMAVTAGVIANGGRRAKLTLLAGQKPEYVRVTSPRIARIVQDMMIEVVRDPTATGPAAAVSGATVAGKTGTAEVGEDLPENAWFAAYAPVPRPKVAVGVLIVGGGAGGDTAAPVAGQVLEAAVRE